MNDNNSEISASILELLNNLLNTTEKTFEAYGIACPEIFELLRSKL
jgi:hypothetical protein